MKIQDRIDKYNQFKAKYLGKKADFDGVYGFQCVDLAKVYASEMYGIILGTFGGSAYTGYENKSKTFGSKWKQVPHTPGNIPIPGDIIFWKPTASNKYGHVAIAGVGSDTVNLVLLEQNYVSEKSKHFGKGTGPASITERKRGYNGFAGSWRFMG